MWGRVAVQIPLMVIIMVYLDTGGLLFMQTMVITGINLFEGGPLSVFYDFLDSIIENRYHLNARVIAFVHRKSLFHKYENDIEIIELPKSRKSYFHRFYYEFLYFKQYSERVDIDIWVSLHDITPNVRAKKIYTYCHNVSPFIKKRVNSIKYCPTNFIFSCLYKYIYRINIKKATSIVVQTEWMRRAFQKMYPVNNVIVARPEINISLSSEKKEEDRSVTRFIYPAFPREFKNFEIICEAVKDIDSKQAEFILTLDGTENRYSRDLRRKYSNIESIRWIGIQPRNKIYELYNSVDCLIFPSSMETWGLPISEFKLTEKDMILIDLPYARETLGDYKRVMFFKDSDPRSLKERIVSVIEGCQKYTPNSKESIDAPYVVGWRAFLELITE